MRVESNSVEPAPLWKSFRMRIVSRVQNGQSKWDYRILEIGDGACRGGNGSG